MQQYHSTTIDRPEVSRALAKALAYKQCGKQELAETWAARLVMLLACADVLNPQRISVINAASVEG